MYALGGTKISQLMQGLNAFFDGLARNTAHVADLRQQVHSSMQPAVRAGQAQTAPAPETAGDTAPAADHLQDAGIATDAVEGARGRSTNWALCEIFAAVQACLSTNDKAGTTSDKDRVEGGKVDGYHENYARACHALHDAHEWSCSVTPEQSIKARCINTVAGESVVQAKFSTISRDVRNSVMSAFNKCTALNPTTMFREIPSGCTAEGVLAEMADLLWKKHGPVNVRAQQRAPTWEYKPLEVFKKFGPSIIGGLIPGEMTWMRNAPARQ